MVSSSSAASATSGLSALDQAIESFINAKPQAQTPAIPQDTVTLTAHSAAPASSVSAAAASASASARKAAA
jgi:hypothetical protein